MNSSTAVIYFARSAGEEVKHKVFCSSNSKLNSAIAQQLYNHSHTQVVKAGLPFFCYTEKNQQGSGFSEKLSNAFLEVFNKGYQAVIAIGSDSPSITSRHITAAAQQLTNNKVVAGATKQGGCYLIGVQRQAFDYSTFKELSWQTCQLSEQIINTFSIVALLPVLSEINKQSHLSALGQVSSKIKATIRRLIVLINSYRTNSFFSFQVLVVPHPFLFSNIFGRAP